MQRINASQVPGVLKRVNAATFRAIVSGAKRGALKGKRHMVPKTKVDRGDLRRSWRVVRLPGAKRGGVSEVAQLLNDAPHAGIIEGGARPHPVSREGRESILNWVIRNRAKFGFKTAKGRARTARVTRRYRSKRSGAILAEQEVHPQLRSIAFLIIRRITTKETEPTWFVRDELDELRRLAGAAIHGAIVGLAKSPIGARGKGGG